ncbi:trypsin-like peptidase domain-containing protein [Pseudoflavitalea sp. X16]|uniref:S1 family peptidase n=1 Tax=Paraflavitalea devenefica TaxID=2716334 RepID=UPI00141DFE3F|nr:serine protease [Paraflavitalea devenefica]NII28279.1 trypsin-like peptidase domain-containing protein [Paraflavitalea devenefica]
MEEMQLLDAVERYLANEMPAEERAFFEQLRKTNPEVDQLVVEHSMFLQQMDRFSDWKQYKSTLGEVHAQLVETGSIKEKAPRATVVQLWKKYQRVVAVAACIAGITALSISSIVYYFAPQPASEIRQLSQQFKEFKNYQQQTNQKINEALAKSTSRPAANPKSGGTGFLIDGKGYLVTSAHTVADADSVYIQNTKGNYFKVNTIYLNKQTDIAVLKIVDNRYQSIKSLPYALQKNMADLGEEVFTMGFPRPTSDIVYNKGYLSAQTGYNGDTTSYQLAISANPGNSGGPIFNHSGEVIGILSGKQTTAEGVVFSSRTQNILTALHEIRKDSTNEDRIKLLLPSSIKGLDRVQQIKKIESCMFMVYRY